MQAGRRIKQACGHADREGKRLPPLRRGEDDGVKRLHRLSHSPPSLCTGRHLTFPRPPRCAPSPFQVKGLIIENTFTSVEDMVGQVWGREGGRAAKLQPSAGSGPFMCACGEGQAPAGWPVCCCKERAHAP